MLFMYKLKYTKSRTTVELVLTGVTELIKNHSTVYVHDMHIMYTSIVYLMNEIKGGGGGVAVSHCYGYRRL